MSQTPNPPLPSNDSSSSSGTSADIHDLEATQMPSTPIPSSDDDTALPASDSERATSVVEVANNTESKDENMNLISDTSDTFDAKSSHGEWKEIITPMPKSNFASHFRNVAVFNLFTDFARYVGLKAPKKKGVHFPEEVIKAAEVKGETSPDGNIPLTNFPYRAAYSQKKSNVVRVVRGAEFKPRLAWIEDTTKCSVQCERLITSCNCLGEYRDPKTVLKEKARKKKHAKDGPKLTKLTESFMHHVNVADFFLIDHKTRTLTFALEDLDGVQAPRETQSGHGRKDSLTMIPENSVEKQISKDENETITEFEYVDELPPLSKSRLGRLSTNIWIFGNCVPLLFTTDDSPTESHYRKLMGHFAALAMSANDAARDVIQQSKDFHNYAFEVMRVIQNLQLRIFLQGDTSVREPLSMGSGLQLLPIGHRSSRPSFEIMIAKVTNNEEPLQFKLFVELGSTHKINALKNLLISTLVEFDHAKHQLDFLVDDVKETTYDSKNDTDLLYRLSEMYNCIVKISVKSEINPTERSMAELKAICETMSKFVLSLNSFISASEHVMEKIMEFRDIVQLTYIYLQEEVKIDLAKLVPPDTPGRIASKMGFKSVRRNGWCCRKKNPTAGNKYIKREWRPPQYSGSDYFRVYYEDAFTFGDAVVDGYVFRVRPANRSEQQERKSKEQTQPIIKFRRSETIGLGVGGTRSYSSVTSNGSIHDGGDGGGEDAPLKPILKEPTPVPSPHGSPEESIEALPDAPLMTRSNAIEEDDEPRLEMKGKDSVVIKKEKDVKKKRR